MSESHSVFDFLNRSVEAKAMTGQKIELPFDILHHFERAGFSKDEINSIVGVEGPYLGQFDLLSADQTDRVVRLNYIVNLAEKVFGNDEKSFIWLRSPNDSLGKRPPLSLLDREMGGRLVEAALLRIEHSVYA